MNKTNMELICQITKETDLTIKYNEMSKTLVFTYDLDGEEVKQVVQEKDRDEHINDQDRLFGYVLEEIYSTLLGAKNNQDTI